MKNLLITIILLTTCFSTLPVLADGVLIPGKWPTMPPYRPPGPPPPAFSIKYHHVDVTIENQIARTRVDQIFKSEHDREMEATYIFPIPEDAFIQEFTLWIGDKEIPGKILDAEEARRIYEEIVRQRKDPGLLEYIGRGIFKASVYPVPPHGEMRIGLEYSELLPQEFQTIRYRYPLNTERFSAKPIASVQITASISSQAPIRNIYSSSHDVSIRRHGDNSATISYEESETLPDKDLVVYYTLSSDEIGLGLLTFEQDGEDGYFLLMASPRAEVQDSEIAAKDVVFVFDRTGSMREQDKIQQAKAALKFCLQTLNPADRFNLITFNENPDNLFSKLVTASPKNIDRALRVAASLDAVGGTNIDEALTTALAQLDQVERPSYVLFLTDGLPTVGVTDISEILQHTKAAAPDHVRIFSFGVGYDVNTTLLDQLATQQRGETEYVRPGEDMEVKVSNLYRKISYPVLSELTVDYGLLDAYDILPAQLPDLFKGSQLVITGRYRGREDARITLSGRARGEDHRFVLDPHPGTAAPRDERIPLIWAQRRINSLLAEIRNSQTQNPELVDEVVRLSKKFGIITEYTSFLVEEPDLLMARDFEKRARESFQGVAESALEAEQGSWGVNQSLNISAGKKVSNAPASRQTYYDKAGREVTISNVRNINNRAFSQHSSNWIDHRFVEGQPVLNIKNYSKAQFQLLEKDPSLGAYMSLGEEVLFFINGQAIQIGPEGADELSAQQLADIFG